MHHGGVRIVWRAAVAGALLVAGSLLAACTPNPYTAVPRPANAYRWESGIHVMPIGETCPSPYSDCCAHVGWTVGDWVIKGGFPPAVVISDIVPDHETAAHVSTVGNWSTALWYENAYNGETREAGCHSGNDVWWYLHGPKISRSVTMACWGYVCSTLDYGTWQEGWRS